MPRTARVVLPNFPHHVIQRGHNRRPIFTENADFDSFLQTLSEWKTALGCKVYAFCLMTNHTHLIVDPGKTPGNLAVLMKRLAGRYTRRMNLLEDRSGTVWNGRFKSSPIETDRYLLACSRYIELNPVRAGMVADPAQYHWSSYRDRIGRPRFRWLDENPIYREMGRTPAERQASYRDWTSAGIPEGEWEFLRTAVQRGQLTGKDRFETFVQRRLGRRVPPRAPGRPQTGRIIKSVPFLLDDG
ncbi:MAG: transposase [bacterium]|nr:transposase [bacterium]